MTLSRRSLKSTATLLVLALAFALPVVPGIVFLLDTARADTAAPWVRVTDLSSLPADGVPRRFQVMHREPNAWERQPAECIGTVFLRRMPQTGQIRALRGEFGHGSPVEYDAEANEFRDCCWDVRCDVDGKPLNVPEAMGRILPLPVRVENGALYVDVSHMLKL